MFLLNTAHPSRLELFSEKISWHPDFMKCDISTSISIQEETGQIVPQRKCAIMPPCDMGLYCKWTVECSNCHSIDQMWTHQLATLLQGKKEATSETKSKNTLWASSKKRKYIVRQSIPAYGVTKNDDRVELMLCLIGSDELILKLIIT